MNAPDDLPEDEMVSAVLDGEADDATRARVLDDPALAERLAEFTSLRDGLQAFTVPDGLLDELRAAAVDQTSRADPADRRAAPTVTAPVFDLSDRRARRAKRATWLGAAAAAVLLIVAVGALNAGSDGDDGGAESSTAAFGLASGSSGSGSRLNERNSSDAAGAPTAAASTGASGSTGSSGAGGTKTDTATGASAAPNLPPTDLGAVADLDALSTRYRTRSQTPTTTASATTVAPTTSCGPAIAVAVLGGRPVALLVEGTQIVVVDRVTCARLGSFTP